MAVFRRKKRIDHLIQACGLLKARGLNFNVRIAGRGFRTYWYRLLIYRLGLQNRIEILPWVKDKAAFFDALDVYCVTSRTESFNISLIEAMAHQTCVLSSACGGPEDIIDHDETGILYKNGDIPALADKLAVLIQTPSKREQLRTAGFEKVRCCFSHEVVEQQLKALLSELIRKGNTPTDQQEE